MIQKILYLIKEVDIINKMIHQNLEVRFFKIMLHHKWKD